MRGITVSTQHELEVLAEFDTDDVYRFNPASPRRLDGLSFGIGKSVFFVAGPVSRMAISRISMPTCMCSYSSDSS